MNKKLIFENRGVIRFIGKNYTIIREVIIRKYIYIHRRCKRDVENIFQNKCTLYLKNIFCILF